MLKKLIALAIAAGFAGATFAADAPAAPSDAPKAVTMHHHMKKVKHQHHQRHAQKRHHRHLASAK